MADSGQQPIRSPSEGPRRHVAPIIAVLLVTASIALLLGCVLLFPRYLVASDVGQAKLSTAELAKARNDVRTTLLQGLGGMVLLVGAYLTWRQIQATREASRAELSLSREGQITERFVQAVEQLGSERLPVRLGGVHALARIARSSDSDRRAVVELLAAYVRANAPWPPSDGAPFPSNTPVTEVPHLPVRAADIQEALTTLTCGLPLPAPTSGTWTINLMGTDLRRAWLSGANLYMVGLRNASLARASLDGADLRGAELSGADLQQANLTGAIADSTTRWPDGFDPVTAGVQVLVQESSGPRSSRPD